MQKLPDGNKITDYCHSKHFSCLDFMLNTLELRPLAKSVELITYGVLSCT